MKTDSSQIWSASDYQENARFVSDLGAPLLAMLNAQPGERILDLGCGDGALTAQIAACGARVLGLDHSEDMLKAARLRGLDVCAMDAQHLTFENEFDAVFSNAVLHWMQAPLAAINGVHRALRDGGRFIGEFGGFGNVAAIVTALLAARRGLVGPTASIVNPWFYPTAEAFSDMLGSAGFAVRSCELIARPTALPTGMRGWLKTFANPFFGNLTSSEREQLLADAEQLLSVSLRDSTGNWIADYVRLRFHAVRN